MLFVYSESMQKVLFIQGNNMTDMKLKAFSPAVEVDGVAVITANKSKTLFSHSPLSRQHKNLDISALAVVHLP